MYYKKILTQCRRKTFSFFKLWTFNLNKNCGNFFNDEHMKYNSWYEKQCWIMKKNRLQKRDIDFKGWIEPSSCLKNLNGVRKLSLLKAFFHSKEEIFPSRFSNIFQLHITNCTAVSEVTMLLKKNPIRSIHSVQIFHIMLHIKQISSIIQNIYRHMRNSQWNAFGKVNFHYIKKYMLYIKSV